MRHRGLAVPGVVIAIAALAPAARAAAQEQQARQMAATFDDAVAKENWRLARAQADVLLATGDAFALALVEWARECEAKEQADG